MSSTQAVQCDGCGALSAHDVHPGGNSRLSAPYPLGWMRLYVQGRRPADAAMKRITSIDVCAPDCAPVALKKAYEEVSA